MTAPTITRPNTVAMSVERARKVLEHRIQMRKYRSDPVLWANDRLGAFLWSKQADIAMAVATNRKTAVKSGHGIGKSHLSAILVLWWLDTHWGEDVLVVTTAPTKSQVTGIMWEYIRKMHREHGFKGTITETAEWKDENRDLIAYGVKPADSNNSGFQGRHYEYTLVILDEACGVDENLFMSAEAVTTTDDCHILAVGNPTDPNTPFGNIFLSNGGRGLSDWDKHTISSLENPNFTNEKVPDDVKKMLTSKNIVDGWREKWGEGSPEWNVRVAGEFPDAADDNMFPVKLLYKGMNNDVTPREGAPIVLGADIARFGSDRCSVVAYHDGLVTIPKVWSHTDTVQSARIIHDIAVEMGATEVRVDGVGVGAGVVDQLRVLMVNHGYMVWDMQGAAASPNAKKWLNARAWWHDHVHDELYKGKMKLPDSETGGENASKLYDEMREIKKKYSTTWQALQIESKDDMKRRKVHSPDISDSLMYAAAPLNPFDPMHGFDPGDTFTTSAYDMVDEFAERGFVIAPC